MAKLQPFTECYNSIDMAFLYHVCGINSDPAHKKALAKTLNTRRNSIKTKSLTTDKKMHLTNNI